VEFVASVEPLVPVGPAGSPHLEGSCHYQYIAVFVSSWATVALIGACSEDEVLSFAVKHCISFQGETPDIFAHQDGIKRCTVLSAASWQRTLSYVVQRE
jgi:hypothetical protein